MDQITGLVPFLGGYPSWVRVLVLAYFVFGAGGYAGLVLFAPTARFALDAVRLAGAAKTGQPIVLDVFAHNPTSARVLVTELRLSLRSTVVPAGGLQSFQTTTARYDVRPIAKSSNALRVSDGRQALATTTVIYPFAGQSYAQVSVPVAQSIEKDSTDRFQLTLSAPGLPREDHVAVDVVAVYNGTLTTDVYTVNLR